MIFYEAPHKLLARYRIFPAAFGAKKFPCAGATKPREVSARRWGEPRPITRRIPPEASSVRVVATARRSRRRRGCTFRRRSARWTEEALDQDAQIKQIAKLTGFAKNQLYDAILKG